MEDPFDLLGLDPSFQLDKELVEERHLRLSRALHPDRHATAPALQRRQALGRAIQVNQAYRVLRDPIARAEALLRRLGVETGEAAQPKADMAFLMDMVDRREALASAKQAKDVERVTDLEGEVRALYDTLVVDLGESFAHALATPGHVPGDALRQKVGELRFCARFLEEVRHIRDELD